MSIESIKTTKDALEFLDKRKKEFREQIIEFFEQLRVISPRIEIDEAVKRLKLGKWTPMRALTHIYDELPVLIRPRIKELMEEHQTFLDWEQSIHLTIIAMDRSKSELLDEISELFKLEINS